MTASDNPTILLITDDSADESNVSHILGKYQFANALVKLHGSAEARRYIAAVQKPKQGSADPWPELILIGARDLGPSVAALLKECRRGALADVPLIFLVDSQEAEMGFRSLNLPQSICVSRPIGFFKLLEAMQKLQMRWMVLKP